MLHAMAVPEVYLHGALRFSLGRLTTEEDIDYVLRVMPGIVMQTRSLSPMFTR